MTCRAATGFVYHDLDFSQPTPMGFARCRRCQGYYTNEQYVAWSCVPTTQAAPVVPFPFGGVPCALCGMPVVVDPMHRAVVEWFGTVCDRCACGHGEASHHHLDNCTQDGCRCRIYRPEETSHD